MSQSGEYWLTTKARDEVSDARHRSPQLKIASLSFLRTGALAPDTLVFTHGRGCHNIERRLLPKQPVSSVTPFAPLSDSSAVSCFSSPVSCVLLNQVGRERGRGDLHGDRLHLPAAHVPRQPGRQDHLPSNPIRARPPQLRPRQGTDRGGATVLYILGVREILTGGRLSARHCLDASVQFPVKSCKFEEEVPTVEE